MTVQAVIAISIGIGIGIVLIILQSNKPLPEKSKEKTDSDLDHSARGDVNKVVDSQQSKQEVNKRNQEEAAESRSEDLVERGQQNQEELARQARERKERIMGKLSPKERDVLQKYLDEKSKKIEAARQGKAVKEYDPLSIFMQIIVILALFAVLYGIFLLNAEKPQSPRELYNKAIEIFKQWRRGI